MNLLQSEQIVTQYLKKLYGFALKNTANLQDAEDLAQEITLKLYRTLLVRDIDNVNAFVWCVAHNTLANYYRSKARRSIGISINDLEDILHGDDDPAEYLIEMETIRKLHNQIAHLSKTQRSIVIMYYYDNKKQEEIAQLLSIPIGTVKWHLFNAKQEIKKGMLSMKNVNELKFNPIKFTMMGLSGSVGTMGGTASFFRSVLSQNIAYCAYHEAKTIHEIADCLGVSPVYVENEVEFLAEYDFLIKTGDKYLTNMIIDEPDETSSELYRLQEEMYTKAAKLISNNLFDALMESDLLESDKLYYPDHDKNYLMWGLLPYLLAWSKEGFHEKIKFEEVASIRKDGGTNIANAGIEDPYATKHKYQDSMKKWCGPMWNGIANGEENLLLWQITTDWSNREVSFDNYTKEIERVLKLLYRFINDETLSKDEYAFLVQKGYLRGANGSFELSILWLKDETIRQQLLEISNQIRAKSIKELEPLKQHYCKAVLATKPKQVQKMMAYGLQHIFYSDGWFLLYTIKELLENGRLQLPTEKQRQSLSTLIMPN